MARWEVTFALERQRGVPLFQQIARAVTKDIRRRRLRSGDRLPGTRTLARALGVQRLTVVAAFDELVAEGSESSTNPHAAPSFRPICQIRRRGE